MKQFSSILSSSLGNILEWYDFGLFTIFAPMLSQLFFPTHDSHTALIATFSIFAVGFICRPIGALIFGYLGDTQGRARTLRLSVLMISVPTLLIGCLPSYQQIGLGAPILLTLTRIWQGISIGGEYSGNLIYLAETAPQKYRATFTSFASIGANLGILLASVIGTLSTLFFTTHTLQMWGWRIPYLISGLLCILIYTFRLRIEETPTFKELKKNHQLATDPVKTALMDYFPYILRTLGLVCMGSTFYYFCFIYIPIFLKQNLQFSMHRISLITTGLISIMIFLVPLAGMLCDRIGRRKMLLMNAILIACLVAPGFYLLHFPCSFLLIPALLVFTLISSLEQGTTCIAVVENFPPQTRYTGLSLGYNIGNGLLGGTVPLICEWLTTKTSFLLAPAFYIAFCAVITGLVVFFSVPETRGKDLGVMDVTS